MLNNFTHVQVGHMYLCTGQQKDACFESGFQYRKTHINHGYTHSELKLTLCKDGMKRCMDICSKESIGT